MWGWEDTSKTSFRGSSPQSIFVVPVCHMQCKLVSSETGQGGSVQLLTLDLA